MFSFARLRSCMHEPVRVCVSTHALASTARALLRGAPQRALSRDVNRSASRDRDANVPPIRKVKESKDDDDSCPACVPCSDEDAKLGDASASILIRGTAAATSGAQPAQAWQGNAEAIASTPASSSSSSSSFSSTSSSTVPCYELPSTGTERVQQQHERASIERPAPQPFRIFRYHPEIDLRPKMHVYDVNLHACGPMVLDALTYIKNNLDSSLALRRSCREGICGSCAMNIDGTNRLACITPIRDLIGAAQTTTTTKKPVSIYPLPHLPVIRDLVADLTPFWKSYHQVKPWLMTDESAEGKLARTQTKQVEVRQSPAQRDLLNGSYECILCACCSTACPSYWWNEDRFLGPAASLQAYRWIIDSRDTHTKQRLAALQGDFAIMKCVQIMNCANVCPKKLNPGKLINRMKRSLWRHTTPDQLM